eukprot:Hpha_TRINITY_DN16421_c2_g1::TRINITY_DN16421_c2_g1_i1::g.158977::m.158977
MKCHNATQAGGWAGVGARLNATFFPGEILVLGCGLNLLRLMRLVLLPLLGLEEEVGDEVTHDAPNREAHAHDGLHPRREAGVHVKRNGRGQPVLEHHVRPGRLGVLPREEVSRHRLVRPLPHRPPRPEHAEQRRQHSPLPQVLDGVVHNSKGEGKPTEAQHPEDDQRHLRPQPLLQLPERDRLDGRQQGDDRHEVTHLVVTQTLLDHGPRHVRVQVRRRAAERHVHSGHQQDLRVAPHQRHRLLRLLDPAGRGLGRLLLLLLLLGLGHRHNNHQQTRRNRQPQVQREDDDLPLVLLRRLGLALHTAPPGQEVTVPVLAAGPQLDKGRQHLHQHLDPKVHRRKDTAELSRRLLLHRLHLLTRRPVGGQVLSVCRGALGEVALLRGPHNTRRNTADRGSEQNHYPPRLRVVDLAPEQIRAHVHRVQHLSDNKGGFGAQGG